MRIYPNRRASGIVDELQKKALKADLTTMEVSKARRNRAFSCLSVAWSGVTTLRSPGEIHTPYCGLYKGNAGAFPCGSSVTGSLMHAFREPGPSRPTSSFHPQAGREPGWGTPEDHEPHPQCTHSLSLPSPTPRAPGGSPDASTVVTRNKGSELAP